MLIVVMTMKALAVMQVSFFYKSVTLPFETTNTEI